MARMQAFPVLAMAAAAFCLAFPDLRDATIEGTVTDGGGKPIAATIVQAHHKVRSVTFQTTTDAGGAYMLGSLPAGTYSMFVKAKGFCAQWYPQVVVGSGQRVRRDFSLNAEKGCPAEPKDFTRARASGLR